MQAVFMRIMFLEITFVCWLKDVVVGCFTEFFVLWRVVFV